MTNTVMIVEDNASNMRLFEDLMKTRGYATVQSTDGHAVIDLARRYTPDLILMDIHLQEVSGVDVTQAVKKDPELASIPVIAVTAFAQPGGREQFLDLGFDGYLSKPVSPRELFKTLDEFFAPRPGRVSWDEEAANDDEDRS